MFILIDMDMKSIIVHYLWFMSSLEAIGSHFEVILKK